MAARSAPGRATRPRAVCALAWVHRGDGCERGVEGGSHPRPCPPPSSSSIAGSRRKTPSPNAGFKIPESHLAGLQPRGAVIWLRSLRPSVSCPDCALPSSHVHSCYERRLADTPVGDQPVLIELTVRRLYCDNDQCGRRTFVEQVTGLTSGTGDGLLLRAVSWRSLRLLSPAGPGPVLLLPCRRG
ncbi:transposase family protein [Streptomyces sp. NBC_00090]|uniref:transposase family protein n=1 Tax=Streptomyces sp. NBC_00090 TaxID=2903619 RepID=UPI00386B8E7E